MSLPQPPVARKIPVRIEQLGRARTDNYAWLKDDNWQAVLRDPSAIKADVKAHLTEENAYTQATLADTEALQATMFAEMKGRVKEDDSSLPQLDGPFQYYARYDIGSQHPIHGRKRRDGTGDETILLNEEAEARGKSFYQVGACGHSPDHRLYAWAVDEQGSEVFRILVKDLETGEIFSSPVESSSGDFTWSPDSQWMFWVHRNDNGRSDKVFRRPARGGATEDVLVYEEQDEGFFVSTGTTSSDSHILISVGDHETSETLIIAAQEPTATAVVFQPRQDGIRYSLDHWNDRFVILTNADDALDFKIMQSGVSTTSRSDWTDLVPHRPGHFITGMMAYRDHLVWIERVDANTQIIILDRLTGQQKPIAMDEDAYVLNIEGGLEYDTSSLRYVYQSPTTPRQWFDMDMTSGERILRKSQEVPSGHTPSDYRTLRVFATAPDGAQVPITLLMKRDTPTDGTAPLLLYGYGSYGMSMDPSFSIRNFSLVDRGWVWATAHVRGGAEKGYGWFLEGRKFKKTNSFDDFIACATHLHAEGYGRPDNTVAYGGSAGGMLMGAVTNMRPDLWAGIIGAVPFVDVLNTMSDTSLPLTPPEWPEWGNPLEDELAYDYIASYSPYDNIEAKSYPAVLATGGLSDPRVTYWEPAKWIARLRECTTSDNPVLLKINMDAGHGGASGRFEFLKEIALDYAFAVWATEKGWMA
jgi:oligopeptidase B